MSLEYKGSMPNSGELLLCVCGSPWWTVDGVNFDSGSLMITGHGGPQACAKCGRPADVTIEDYIRGSCSECGGTGLVDGWPLPGQGDAISAPMTADNPNPKVQHRCPSCSAAVTQ